MAAFHPPIPRDNYCRKHGSSYSGSFCPECASDREKEAKYRVCPSCQETRIVNTKYVYCVNSKCRCYSIMYLKEEISFRTSLSQETSKNEDREILSNHQVLVCPICGRITLVQETKTMYKCVACKAIGSTPESIRKY